MPSPFGVERPTWKFDPSFDVRWHVRELVLEPPGTLDQLFAAAAHIHEMGIGCAIASYDGTLYLGLTSDLGAAPDAHLLSEYLVDLTRAQGSVRRERHLTVSPGVLG